MRDDETGLAPAPARASGSGAGEWAPDPWASCYALGFLLGGPTTAGRRRRQKGVALGTERLYWNAGADATRAYGQVSRISLSFYDKVEGGGGSCRVDFADGSSLTVLSGIHAGVKSAEREAAYDAFLNDLHARLSEVDRQRIAFHDGFPIPNSGVAILAGAVGAVGFVPAVIAAFTGDARFINALTFSVIAGGVTALGLIFAQGRTEGRRYDPDSLPKHALSGQGRDERTAPAPVQVVAQLAERIDDPAR